MVASGANSVSTSTWKSRRCSATRPPDARVCGLARAGPQHAMPDSDRPEKLDYVRGDATGLDIPAHPAALRAVGENFLTQALQEIGRESCRERVCPYV